MGTHRDSLAADTFGDYDDIYERSEGNVLPGSFASLDSTLPPTPMRDALAADGASIFVLSADADLADALEQAAGGRFPLFFARRWRDLVTAVADRRTQIVLIDVDTLNGPLEAALAELRPVSADLIVVVAANGGDSHRLMRLMTERKIYRLLIKPAASDITRLLLESAVGRYLQSRDQRHDDSFAPEVEPEIIRSPRRVRRPRRARKKPWRLAAVLVLAAVGGVMISGRFEGGSADVWRGITAEIAAWTSAAVAAATSALGGTESRTTTEGADSIAPAARVESPAAAVESPAAGVDSPAERGESSVVPVEPSGAPVEQTAAPVEPPPVPALRAAEPTEQIIQRADTGAAPSAAWPAVHAAEPQRESAAAAPRSEARSAEGAPPASIADDTELVELLSRVDQRLAAGRVAGGRDTALAYFERAVALGSNDPRVLSRRTALADGLAREAGVAVERGALEDAQRLAADAFRLGAERETLARIELDLAAALQARALERQSVLLSRAEALMRDGRLLGRGGDNALTHLATLRREGSTLPGIAAAWGELIAALTSSVRAAIVRHDFATAKAIASALAIDGGDPELASKLGFDATQAEFLAVPVASSVLDLVDSPPPVYPTDALRAGTEGWVDLEFIVDQDGRTRDIAVVDSRPRRRFDDAALQTVARQRYAPFVSDGRTYARRVRVRIRFDLE